jgi:hypothetical protein
MKKSIFLLFLPLFLISSCKKDKENDINTDYAILNEQDISEITDGANFLSSKVQDVMFSYVTIAADSGLFITYPQVSSKKSTGTGKEGKKSMTDGDWTGPDANGWYTRVWESLYKYIERVRCCDTAVDYEFIISYDGADGSYESINKTEYARYTVNGKVLYKGYWDWSVSNSGYNDISSIHWQMRFNDWDPLSGAGVFDWYWGATSNGGDDVPFYRYLNIIATDIGNEWLNVKITSYDGNTEIWSFDYDTPWDPVEMPELHTCDMN